MQNHAVSQYYAVLVRISPGYSPLTGRLHTCYSPVRRSPPEYCYPCAAPRLACVRPVASVHPEPGSNSSLYLVLLFARMLSLFWFIRKLTWYKKKLPFLILHYLLFMYSQRSTLKKTLIRQLTENKTCTSQCFCFSRLLVVLLNSSLFDNLFVFS